MKHFVYAEHGFASLAEIIITSIIFVMAAFGIMSTVSMLKPQGTDSTKKLEAAYVAKGVLEDLRNSVDASKWSTPGNDLEPGDHTKTVTRGGITYTVTYTVTQDADGSRRVDLKIPY